MSNAPGNWKVGLIEAHRDLFQPPAGLPAAAQGSPDCGEGWRDLLDRLCVRIRAVVRADGGTFRFTQVKEKYATLRVYWTGALSPEADARIEEAIALAEARSAVTCEICGEPGVLHGPRWFTTRCEAHAEARRPIAAQPGDDIHVMERVVGGDRQTLRQRYDRAKDAFVDADPFTPDSEAN